MKGLALAALAVLTPLARAQEPPSVPSHATQARQDAAKSPLKLPRTIDRRYLLATSLLGASTVADGWTTERMLNAGGRELNPLMGARPSTSRVAGVSAGTFAAEVGLAYVLKRYGRGRWWGRLWWIEPGWGTSEH